MKVDMNKYALSFPFSIFLTRTNDDDDDDCPSLSLHLSTQPMLNVDPHPLLSIEFDHGQNRIIIHHKGLLSFKSHHWSSESP